MEARNFKSIFSVILPSSYDSNKNGQFDIEINLQGYKSIPLKGNLQGDLLCTGLTPWYVPIPII